MLYILLVTCAATELPDSRASGIAYFERLARDRNAITAAVVEYSVHNEKNDRYREIAGFESLEGSTHEYRVWLEPGNFRVDVHDVRPSDPKAAFDRRYAHAGGVYRLIEIDKPNAVVREYSDAYKQRKNPPAIPRYLVDPRLLGVIPTEYDLMSESSLDELRSYVAWGTISAERFVDGGAPASRVVVRDPGGSVITYIVHEGSDLPVRMVTEFAKKRPNGAPLPQTRVEIDVEHGAVTDAGGRRFDYPRSLKSRRITNGKEVARQTIRITTAVFNEVPDASVYTWKALKPREGARLIIDDKFFTRTVEVWSEGKFRALRPEEIGPGNRIPIGPAASRILNIRIVTYVLFGNALLLGAIAAYMAFTKHKQSANPR